jgi:hypothetical protein
MCFNHSVISDRLIFDDATRGVNFSNSEFFAEKAMPFCRKNNTVQAIPVRLFPSVQQLSQICLGRAMAESSSSGSRRPLFPPVSLSRR